MNEDGALFDSGFDGGKPFRDTPEAGSISLESALRDFGPAAIDDLIPRLRRLATALDAAHAKGVVHGALHPSKVFITDEATALVTATSSSAPYVAPEMSGGEGPTPQSDQFGLAAIAYEWMFGRPIDRPAERPIEVRTMPGVDRAALSRAFTRALAPKPADRFASCTAFCDALTASTAPELPLVAPKESVAVSDMLLREPGTGNGEPEDEVREDDVREDEGRRAEVLRLPAPGPRIADTAPAVADTFMRPRDEAPRFGGFALILAALVGAVFGFAAGYMAIPRALQTSAPQEIRTAPGTEAPITSAQGAPRAKNAAKSEAPAPKAPAPEAPKLVGRLLVRTNPSGATVSVDGVEKGVTPLALRDLDMGTRNITVARRGYISESRRVLITNDRPSRSLDVRLTASASAATPKPTPKPSTPATIGKPAVSTGSLAVDSRPTGASVTINGKPSGTTPLTIPDLPPGEYAVVMSKAGFRNVATTVRVVAGERVRAAASLTVQE